MGYSIANAGLKTKRLSQPPTSAYLAYLPAFRARLLSRDMQQGWQPHSHAALILVMIYTCITYMLDLCTLLTLRYASSLDTADVSLNDSAGLHVALRVHAFFFGISCSIKIAQPKTVLWHAWLTSVTWKWLAWIGLDYCIVCV